MTVAQGVSIGGIGTTGKSIKDGLHVVVRMNFAIANLLFDAIEKGLDVSVEVPLVDACERGEGQCVQPLGDAQVVPPANIFLVRIIGPGVVGNANNGFLDIDEPGCLQVLARPVVVCDWARDSPCCVGKVSVPLHELALGVERTIVAARLHINLNVFYPTAARLEVSAAVSASRMHVQGACVRVDFLIQLWPACDAAAGHP